MNKSQLLEKAKEQGIEVDDKMTKAQIEELLGSVNDSLVNSPESSVRSQSGSKGKGIAEHSKFSKFKRRNK